MYVQFNILILHAGANYKTGATPKPVNELNRTRFSEFSALPRVRDALKELLRALGRDCWSLKRLLLAVENDDRRLADVQPQLIRSIGKKQMQEIAHRIHAISAGIGQNLETIRFQSS